MTADSEVGRSARKKREITEEEREIGSEGERSAKTMADNETENQRKSGSGANRYAPGTVSRDTLLKLPFAFPVVKAI